MAGDYSVVTADYVNVQISNSLTSFASEKRFPKSITIAELKVDLVHITIIAMSGTWLYAYLAGWLCAKKIHSLSWFLLALFLVMVKLL